jgi:hypothetical protein
MTTTIEATYYLALPDGRAAYPMPPWDYRAAKWVAGEQPAETWIDTIDYGRSTLWVITAGPVQEITCHPKAHQVLAGYRLRDMAAASEKYPATLTAEEMASHSYDEREVMGGLYEGIYEDGPTQPVVYDVSALVAMPGVADTRPAVQWAADKAHLALYGLTYATQLPGVITGVKDLVAAALKERFGREMNIYDHDSSKISVHLTTGFDVPQFTSRQNKSRRTGKPIKGTTTVPARVSTYFDFTPVRTIAGATKADALIALDAAIEEYSALVESYRPVACHHCKGNGYVTGPNSMES